MEGIASIDLFVVPTIAFQQLIVFNAEHLQRILAGYAAYYNEMRTHVSLGKDAPVTRPVERRGDIVAYPVLWLDLQLAPVASKN